MMFLIVLFAFAFADDDGCPNNPIRLTGLKYYTRHAVNSTAPEVGLSDVLDAGHGRMLAFGYPNTFFTAQDALDMDNACKASYKLNWGIDFNPATNPNAVCIPGVGICQIIINGTVTAAFYPFREENAFDIRVLVNTKDTYMNCGGYVQVVYMTLMLYSGSGVVQPPALQAGQRYQPFSNAGCGWTGYWLKNSNPLGTTRGRKNFKKFWLDTTRLGNFAPNPFVSNEAKITLNVVDEEGNRGFYMDNQYINFKWAPDGSGVGTRFAQDEFIFPLDTPLSAAEWVAAGPLGN